MSPAAVATGDGIVKDPFKMTVSMKNIFLLSPREDMQDKGDLIIKQSMEVVLA